MSLGFSFGSTPTQSVQPSPQAASIAMLARADKPQGLAKDFELLARTAALAAQIGAGTGFFRQIYTNSIYVARMAFPFTAKRNDDPSDKKRADGIYRKLKTENSEATNNHQAHK